MPRTVSDAIVAIPFPVPTGHYARPTDPTSPSRSEQVWCRAANRDRLEGFIHQVQGSTRGDGLRLIASPEAKEQSQNVFTRRSHSVPILQKATSLSLPVDSRSRAH